MSDVLSLRHVIVVAVVILVRVAVWMTRSKSDAPMATPDENHLPQRPQMGDYDDAGPGEHSAR